MTDYTQLTDLGQAKYIFARTPTASEVDAQLHDLFVNSATGMHFICTDATPAAQVWLGTDGNEYPGYILDYTNPAIEAGWTMDSVSGSTLNDETANGNNGTITGATQVAGQIGNALSFDGVNDVVAINQPAGGFFPSSGFSVTGWIRTSDSIYPLLNSVWNGSSFTSDGFQITTVGSDIRAQFRNGASHITLINTDFNNDSTWQFFALVCDGVTAELSINDGTRASMSISGYTPNATNQVFIGTQDNDSGWYSGGSDEYRVANRPLTDTEVTEIYQEGSP